MKKLTMITLFYIIYGYSQTISFVENNHPVYKFLDRIYTAGIINDYDAFELPKTIKEISFYRAEAEKNRNLMIHEDIEFLDNFRKEFAFELNNDKSLLTSLLSDFNADNYLRNKRTHIYFEDDSVNGTAFMVNLDLSGSFITRNNRNKGINSALINFGGTIKGSLNNFGFMIKGTNGTFRGDKELTFEYPGLRYNYKYNLAGTDVTYNDYYDNTQGYLLYEKNNFKFKIARENVTRGYGEIKTLSSVNNSVSENIGIALRLNRFSYNYSLEKAISFIDEKGTKGDKYIAYHRFNFRIGDNHRLSAGEIVVYGDRLFDLSYLNPFVFYKSLEHSNLDRDNSMLFFNYETNVIKNITLFGEVIIDDIDFSKIGTGWYGNKILYSGGCKINFSNLFFPTLITLQTVRLEPYMFTHHKIYNNYTKNGYNLSDPLSPNSINYNMNINLQPDYWNNFEIDFGYVIHANNKYDETGKLLKNFGGNINEGYKNSDNQKIGFLEGEKEYYKCLSFSYNRRFLYNYNLKINIQYRNGTKDRIKYNDFYLFCDLGIKL